MQAFASRRRQLLGLGMTGLAVLTVSAGTMMSLALFTDTETDDSSFTTGTIVLDATKIDALELTVTNMMPGDTTRSPVTVENDGTSELRYAVSQTSTDDGKNLRGSLNLAVRTPDTGAGNTFAEDGDHCDDADGTSVRASAAMGASGNVVGDPTSGSQSGDRTLAAAGSEVLCFYVSLPSSAGDSLQGATTTTTFTFAAEQTANN